MKTLLLTFFLLLQGSPYGKNESSQQDPPGKKKAPTNKIRPQDMPFWLAAKGANNLAEVAKKTGEADKDCPQTDKTLDKTNQPKKSFDSGMVCGTSLSKSRIENFLDDPKYKNRWSDPTYRSLAELVGRKEDKDALPNVEGFSTPKQDREKSFEDGGKSYDLKLSYRSDLFLDDPDRAGNNKELRFFDRRTIGFDLERVELHRFNDTQSLYGRTGLSIENRSNTEPLDTQSFEQDFFEKTQGYRPQYGKTNEYRGEVSVGLGFQQLLKDSATCRIFSRSEFDYIKSTHKEDDRGELRSYLSWNDLNRDQNTGRVTDSWSFITGVEADLDLREGYCTSANISLDLLHSIRGKSCVLQYGLGLDIPIYDQGNGFGGLDSDTNANDPTLFFSVGLRF